MPSSAAALGRATIITEVMPGFPEMNGTEWLELARAANRDCVGFSALPEAAQQYVSRIESLLGIKIHSVGVGPDREATVMAAE
jgi:adenylosuccinate synthase